MSAILDRLSLSTCWCSARHTDGYEMIVEMLSLGFKRVELSHGIRLSLVPGILKAVDEGIVEISSVHNFCPLPSSTQRAAPNLYQPSSKNPSERHLWLRYSLQTLDFAKQVGAADVVMHSGSLHFFFISPEVRLKKWIKKSNISTSELSENNEFIDLRERAMKRISKVSQKTMCIVKNSYEELLSKSEDNDVRLCLENREAMQELPIDYEYDSFLKNFKLTNRLGYWHDTGHAQIKDQLGLFDHGAHLEKMAPFICGFHLHDVSGAGHDHQVPGTGTVDFRMISKFVLPEHCLVLELSPLISADEVLASRDYIANIIK